MISTHYLPDALLPELSEQVWEYLLRSWCNYRERLLTMVAMKLPEEADAWLRQTDDGEWGQKLPSIVHQLPTYPWCSYLSPFERIYPTTYGHILDFELFMDEVDMTDFPQLDVVCFYDVRLTVAQLFETLRFPPLYVSSWVLNKASDYPFLCQHTRNAIVPLNDWRVTPQPSVSTIVFSGKTFAECQRWPDVHMLILNDIRCSVDVDLDTSFPNLRQLHIAGGFVGLATWPSHLEILLIHWDCRIPIFSTTPPPTSLTVIKLIRATPTLWSNYANFLPMLTHLDMFLWEEWEPVPVFSTFSHLRWFTITFTDMLENTTWLKPLLQAMPYVTEFHFVVDNPYETESTLSWFCDLLEAMFDKTLFSPQASVSLEVEDFELTPEWTARFDRIYHKIKYN